MTLPVPGLRPRPATRLRSDLLFRLMWPLLAIVAATGAVGGIAAHRLTNRVFDRWLLDAASSLANQVRFEQGTAQLDLPQAAATMLVYDEFDKAWFSVRQSDKTLAGEPDLPTEGKDGQVYQRGQAFDATYRHDDVRIARVEVTNDAGHSAIVLVGETMLKRRQAEKELLLVLAPMALLLLAAAVAIHIAVRRTITPLEAMAARWNQHSHASLQPIGVDSVPRELLPFATALNGLLERTRNMLDRERQFAANAAHQLRTPLAGLGLGLARAAQASDLAATREVIGELIHATQRTSRLVKQLLAMARLDTGLTIPFEFEAMDLRDLAHDIGGAYIDQALEKGIDFELRTPDEPVLAAVHREMIGEAIGNLLDNALRYAPHGGQVTIDVQADPPAIAIGDNGPGIAEGERSAVFQRFVRGRSAIGDGSGLGLAIVKDIAQLHGGSVVLASGTVVGIVIGLRLRPPSADELRRWSLRENA